MRRSVFLTSALTALAPLALAACGGDESGKPSGTRGERSSVPRTPGVVVSREQDSDDPAIAWIQHRIRTQLAKKEIDTTARGWRSHLPFPFAPPTAFDPKKDYLWTLDTDHGALRVRLFARKAPKHVAAIVHLSLMGFYDGLTLHRVVRGKAVEGGDPVGDGLGSPGWVLEPEYAMERDNAHDRRGLVTSTGIGGPTDDSKFRILLAPDPSLDRQSTVLGEVEAGMDVVAKIEALGTETGDPKERIVIVRADVSIR